MGTRRPWILGLAVITAVLGAVGADAATVTEDGYQTGTAGRKNSISISAHESTVAPYIRLDVVDDGGHMVIGSGFTRTPDDALAVDPRPLRFCSIGFTPGDWTCIIAFEPNRPFRITGGDGNDLVDWNCAHAGTPQLLDAWPAGSPCPRRADIALGGGDDELRVGAMWSDISPPADHVNYVGAGITADMGAGDDNLLVAAGPTSGTGMLGAGRDFADTTFGTGIWTISCGPGVDVVRAGPDDVVGADCERVNGNSRPRAVPDRIRPNRNRARLVVRPLANDRDGGTAHLEEERDTDTEGRPLRIHSIVQRPRCGRLTLRSGLVRFIPPRAGCRRAQVATYRITDGLLVSLPARILLPAVPRLR